MEQQEIEYWRKFLPLAEAMAQGKEIQFRSREAAGAWLTYKICPSAGRLDFRLYEFRPKPQPQWRPFKNASEFARFRDKWFYLVDTTAHGESPNHGMRALQYDNFKVTTLPRSGMVVWTYEDLFKQCQFEDGHPCGTFDDEFFLVSDPDPKQSESAS